MDMHLDSDSYTEDTQVSLASSERRDMKNSIQFSLESLYANSRKGFIRKVYTIVGLQLLFTIIVSIVAMNV